MGCFRGSLVQLASSGEILATCATRYHLSFRKLLEWYQSQVKSSQVIFCRSEQLFEIFLHSLHTSLIFFGFLSTLTTINGINFWMCEFGLLKILMFCRKVFSILLHFFYSFMISCLLEEITKIPLVSPIFHCVTIL